MKQLEQKRRLAPLSIPFAMMGGFAAASLAAGAEILRSQGFGNGGSVPLIVGAAVVVTLYWLYRRATGSVMLCADTETVEVQPIIGEKKVLHVSKSVLVISNTFIAFRPVEGNGEVLLSRGFFRKKEWESVIDQLQTFPFHRIVGGRHE